MWLFIRLSGDRLYGHPQRNIQRNLLTSSQHRLPLSIFLPSQIKPVVRQDLYANGFSITFCRASGVGLIDSGTCTQTTAFDGHFADRPAVASQLQKGESAYQAFRVVQLTTAWRSHNMLLVPINDVISMWLTLVGPFVQQPGKTRVLR